MSEEKKSKEPKLTIRETPIIHYEVIDENGDGEPECDEFGNNLFETREEAERVLAESWSEDNENEISNAYFNAIDLQRTISSNGLNDIKRVHDGTDNEDTMKDLIDDLVSFLTGILPEGNNE